MNICMISLVRINLIFNLYKRYQIHELKLLSYFSVKGKQKNKHVEGERNIHKKKGGGD